MIELKMSNYEAIALHCFIDLTRTLRLESFPQNQFSSDDKIASVFIKLEALLNAEKKRQESEPEWAKEDLEPLKMTAPADWNEYNDYLLAGGMLEYDEWKTPVIKLGV